MKYFLVLLFIAYIALAEAIREKVEKYKYECVEETSPDFDVLINAIQLGGFPDDEKLNNFFLCFFKKLGFINEAGGYDVEKITAMSDKDERKWVKNCTESSFGDELTTAVKLAKCYFEKKIAASKLTV